MLKEFSFRNCRSFKDESTLSMEANPALKDNFNFVVQRGCENNAICLNPVAAIYGSNAGGKTNLLRALSDALKNIHVGLGFRNISYMYDDSIFTHKLNIVCGDSEYIYEYTIDNNEHAFDKTPEVLKESLLLRKLSPRGRLKKIFIRERDQIKESCYREEVLSFLNMMALNKENLIMKMAGEVGFQDFLPFYKWCSNVVVEMRDLGEQKRISDINNYATALHMNKLRTSELNDFKKFMIKFDPSISKLSTMPDEPRREKKKSDESGTKINARFLIWHKKSDGKTDTDMPFLVESASNGTKKLMELYPLIREALAEGMPFVCDELDTLLHPLVFKNVINMFNDKEHNPNGAQLIFTAHNTIAMNRECLRRDEIHFVDKDEYGKSSVFRLSDVADEDGNRIRMDARYDRLYLAGFFGATPDKFHNASIRERGKE